MKGRNPKTPALDALHGKPGRRPKKDFFPPAPLPSVPADPWAPPPWLLPGAQTVWAREIDPARRQARLQSSQLPLFACYCDALHRLELYTAALAGGATYKTPSGYYRTLPEVGLRDRAAADVKQFAAELMLTPKSWASGMGTYAGRQLELFRDPLDRPAAAPATAAPQPESASLDAYVAARPQLH